MACSVGEFQSHCCGNPGDGARKCTQEGCMEEETSCGTWKDGRIQTRPFHPWDISKDTEERTEWSVLSFGYCEDET